MRRWTNLSSGLLAALIAAGGGCSVSPRPEPPPTPAAPSFELDRVGLSSCLDVCDAPSLIVQARPGAVSDPDALVWIVNLDHANPGTLVDVALDGSFSAAIEAVLGDEVRMQARKGDLRGEPVDFVFASESDTVITPSAHALRDCLTLAPPTHVALHAPGPSSASVVVTNDCAQPARIQSVRVREDPSPFTHDAPVDPFDLAPGAQRDIRIQLTSSDVDVLDGILFIEVSAPAFDRRPVTLFVTHDP